MFYISKKYTLFLNLIDKDNTYSENCSSLTLNCWKQSLRELLSMLFIDLKKEYSYIGLNLHHMFYVLRCRVVSSTSWSQLNSTAPLPGNSPRWAYLSTNCGSRDRSFSNLLCKNNKHYLTTSERYSIDQN